MSNQKLEQKSPLPHTSETNQNIFEARNLVPQLANLLSPETGSLEETRASIDTFIDKYESAIANLFGSHLATKKFFLAEGITQQDQERLRQTLEMSSSHLLDFFQALLDPTGQIALTHRPSQADMEQIYSLVNPKLPQGEPNTELGKAFFNYAPNHPQNLYAWGPTILLNTLYDAAYQSQVAPYGGHTLEMTREFYLQYQHESPEYFTVPPTIDRRQWSSERIARKLYFEDGGIGYMGVGVGREVSVANDIAWGRAPNVHNIFSKANKPFVHHGFDILPQAQSTSWLDQYHQIPLEKIQDRPELRNQLLILFAFGSPYMDVILTVNYLKALAGASHLLKPHGLFLNDQAFPSTYSREEELFHKKYPQEPYGLFERSWPRGSKKIFSSPRIEDQHFYTKMLGLEPSISSYADTVMVRDLLKKTDPRNKNFISDLQNGRKLAGYPLGWQKRVSQNFYQTQTPLDWYTRWTPAYEKVGRPDKFLKLVVGHLSRSPAFAPKPEE